MNDRALSKKELLRELGIADRLLKFWVNWYKLPVNRRGRGSNYPPQTVHTLRIIKRLSDSRYFTMRFVRDLLASRGADPSAPAPETPALGAAERLTHMETHLDLCRDILNGARVRPRVSAAPRPAPSPASSAPQKRIGEDLL